MRCASAPNLLPQSRKRPLTGVLPLMTLGAALLSTTAGALGAAEVPPTENIVLDRTLRQAIIQRVAGTFEEYYIDPDVARELGERLEARAAAGGYRRFDSLEDFTAQLTQDLRDWSDDLHITIMPYEPLPEYRVQDRLVGDPEDNYGFRKVEILPGNIGYLQLDGFYSAREAGPTAVAAMNYLAHCRALVIDLRLNGGGDTSTALLLSSYLLSTSTLLSSHYYRFGDRTLQDWTYTWVPGPRLTDVPVYILLSRLSFSCAESFSFNLQQLGRAVIVGEQTPGGGHSVTYLSFPEEHVNVRVPYSRVVSAATGLGYQSVGVTPDIPATGPNALAAALVAIAQNVLKESGDEHERFRFEWILKEGLGVIDPVTATEEDLKEYVGTYGTETVTLECGELIYRDHVRPARHLVFLGDDLFTWRSDAGYSRYRTRFVRDDAGAVTALYVVDDDGDQFAPVLRTSE